MLRRGREEGREGIVQGPAVSEYGGEAAKRQGGAGTVR